MRYILRGYAVLIAVAAVVSALVYAGTHWPLVTGLLAGLAILTFIAYCIGGGCDFY